jgi:putative membrane protein
VSNPNVYLWIKSLHVISLVAWFAGLFYIFRLFVYHVQNKGSLDMSRVFKTMELKLLRIIVLPASIATILTGTSLVWMEPLWLKQGWFHVKILFVIFLMIYQWVAFLTRKQFERDNFIFTERQCRIINEVPTIILAVVVLMVILKP